VSKKRKKKKHKQQRIIIEVITQTQGDNMQHKHREELQDKNKDDQIEKLEKVIDNKNGIIFLISGILIGIVFYLAFDTIKAYFAIN